MQSTDSSGLVLATVLAKNTPAARGWILYDGDCGFCRRSLLPFAGLFQHYGIEMLPFKDPQIQAALEKESTEVPDALRLLAVNGRMTWGADALLEICRSIWWAWPLYKVGSLPGIRHLLRWGYSQIAARRHCLLADRP